MSEVNWDWRDFCPTGLTPYEPNSNDLLPCFQVICLQIPIYSIFVVVCSYYFGAFYRPVNRNSTQLRLICIRVTNSLGLALLPVLKIFYLQQNDIFISASDVLVVCIECLMWVIHSGK